jgi:uncharacterized protein YyaL (SSP411 family)
VNRLAHEPSLYLRQHADNPVDWYPWGPEALDRAAAEDIPLLVSIGYSSCHWCHVMAHESFEDPEIAAVLNDRFVCIKVDREERPDIDALYMNATLLLARQGGWPMTVFATPDGRPYFAGTYFPPVSRGSMPGFADVCTWMADVYRDRTDEVDAQATEIVAHIARGAERAAAGAPVRPDTIEASLAGMVSAFDTAQGGFGGAPKFPPSNVLEFLVSARVGQPARDMALVTLRRMADGGIRDHLSGGFHRYAVDDRWLVPHFEKMLYDNALLARAYIGAARADTDPRWREIAEQTLDYLVAEMELPGGGFAASQDADSPGGEGAFFVWTPSEISALMPEAEAHAVMLRFGITDAGNFEGRNILHAALPIPMVAAIIGSDPEPLIAAGLAAMRAARATRAAPARDDKLVVAWNGLAIAAFADAGTLFGRGDYVETAARAADRILDDLVIDGRLFRTLQNGTARHLGQLEDYADLAHGLLQLYAATFAPRWLTAARTLADDMVGRFADQNGGFFATGSDAPALLVRLRDVDDQPTPSGNSQAASVLCRLAGLTGRTDLLELAESAIAGVAGDIPRVPLSFGTALGVIDALSGPRREIAIVGAHGDPRTEALIAAARAGSGAGDVIAVGDPADSDRMADVPLLAARGLVDGAPAAYVCEHFSCQSPVQSPDELSRQLVG